MSTDQIVFAAALTMISAVIGFSTLAVVSTLRSARPTIGAASGRGPSWGSLYRGGGGQWAFVAHRVSGIMVFCFLLLHIVDVSLIRWPDVYDRVHRLYGTPLLRAFEVGLLFALLFHALNGIRLIAVDSFPDRLGARHRWLRTVVLATAIAGIPGAIVIMAPVWL
ncbi:MAG: succinate dehydrogenase, cytochrome b556 subunit [Acidimicrobiales bacterium]